jgi:hypothetical protein
MQWPKFIIIGATKCGTTALWYNLDKHPDIHMALKSRSSVETNFWGGRRWKSGFEWYKKRFPDDKIGGEKTVAYYINKKAFRLMHKYIPDVKLFFCVRNPVDRAYSNYQMHLKAGKVGSFNEALFHQRYARAGKYIYFINNNILPFFDKSQLYICVTEHMKKDPTNEMKKVFDFLGVEDLNYPKKIIHGQLLKNRTRVEDVELNHKEKFYRVWSKHKDVLSGPMRQYVVDYYKDYNLRLYDYLGYRIKEWDK